MGERDAQATQASAGCGPLFSLDGSCDGILAAWSCLLHNPGLKSVLVFCKPVNTLKNYFPLKFLRVRFRFLKKNKGEYDVSGRDLETWFKTQANKHENC